METSVNFQVCSVYEIPGSMVGALKRLTQIVFHRFFFLCLQARNPEEAWCSFTLCGEKVLKVSNAEFAVFSPEGLLLWHSLLWATAPHPPDLPVWNPPDHHHSSLSPPFPAP